MCSGGSGRISRYHDIFQGQLYYVNEELIEGFIDFMTCGSDDAVRIFLEKFTAEVRASDVYKRQVSDGTCLRGDALLRGLLRTAAVRHRALHLSLIHI